jgi:hypothetical protein
MTISPEKIEEVLDQHSRRLLNNMTQEELYSFALQSMKQSFDQNPGVGDTDEQMLMSSIMQEEEYDDDSFSEFLTGCGLEDEEIDETILKSLKLEDWAKFIAKRTDKMAENN